MSTCRVRKQYTENVNVAPSILTGLVGVLGTNYTFSKSLNPSQFQVSLSQLEAQQDQFIGPYANIVIPNSPQTGIIVSSNDLQVLNNIVNADVVCTNQCISLGFAAADSMQIVITDGTFICSGNIGYSNSQMAPQIVNSIMNTFKNVNLNNVHAYLGPSARSPYYYVAANVYNTYTQAQQSKYFVELNASSKDSNGNYILNAKDRASGTPRYGFDFSVLFNDGLVSQGIPAANIVHDPRNTMNSTSFTSARAASNSYYNSNPTSTLGSTAIGNTVGRNFIFSLF